MGVLDLSAADDDAGAATAGTPTAPSYQGAVLDHTGRVTAPSEADDTSDAYLASTPRV